MQVVHLCNYGIGNSLNVKRAFEKLGAVVNVCESGDEIQNAEILVIPGVGAFSDCMNALSYLGFESKIKELVANGCWVLGICVGMQMLGDHSAEFGFHKGLGLISGSVKRVGEGSRNGVDIKLPHVGWSRVSKSGALADNDVETLNLDGMPFYFVHSFEFRPDNRDHFLATTNYSELEIVAAVKRDRVIGVQFHPEKSGESGLLFLRNFLAMAGVKP